MIHNIYVTGDALSVMKWRRNLKVTTASEYLSQIYARNS